MTEKPLKIMLSDKRVKYLLVGAWNTVFGYLAFVALYMVGVRLGLHYMYALVASQVIGITNAYICYKLLVFRTRGNVMREYLRFYVVYGLAFLINVVLMVVFVDELGVNPLIAQGLIAAIVVVISYLGHSKYSFRLEPPLEQ
jgi:putative flippase GtrA